MRSVGIICEYNPLHCGHAYLMEQVKEMGTVVCVMSGNFTQRGEAAILPPVLRAEMAMAAGADLVVELPFPHAAASARYFATGGIRALQGLSVDAVAFGSETGDIAALRELAARAPREDFRKGDGSVPKSTGDAAAYFAALGEALSSNDILALEYLRAIEQEKAAIHPVTIRRLGAGYRETVSKIGEFASAGALRRALFAGEDTAAFIPSASDRILKRYLAEYPLARTERLGDAMLAVLRGDLAKNAETVSKNALFAECGGGLLHRLQKAALRATDYVTLCREAATKRYTDGRIRRALLFRLAGVTREDLVAPPAYLRLLAANERGRAFLAETAKTRTVPVVTKQSAVEALGASADRQRRLALVSDGLYSICTGGALSLCALQTARPYISSESTP